MSAEKEIKFMVFKMKDVEGFLQLHPCYKTQWDAVIKGIGRMRQKQGKVPYNNYVCCNQDEPYAEKVWQTILQGEDEKDKK